MMRRFLVSLGAVGLTAASVTAQSAPQPAALPMEFVEALMPARSQLGRMGEYRPGELPPHLPPGVADGATLIGSIVWPDQSRTALLMPGAPAAARARVEAQLLAAGFSHRTPADEPRGFRPPPPAARDGGYCSPADDQATIEALPAPTGSRVVVQFYAANDGRRCSAQSTDAPAFTGGAQELLPTLRVPDGVRLDGQSSGSGGGFDSHFASSQASASGPVAADAMLQHFRPQWQEQGWTLRTEVADATAGVQVWERQEPGGSLLVGSVTAIRASAEELSLVLNVRTQGS